MGRIFLKICSLEYKAHLKSDYWHEVQRRVLERDGYKCRICGFIDSFDECTELQVHHISGRSRFKEAEDLDSLMLLCEECHDRIHNFFDARDYVREHKQDAKHGELYDKCLAYVNRNQNFADRYFSIAKAQNGY